MDLQFLKLIGNPDFNEVRKRKGLPPLEVNQQTSEIQEIIGLLNEIDRWKILSLILGLIIIGLIIF